MFLLHDSFNKFLSMPITWSCTLLESLFCSPDIAWILGVGVCMIYFLLHRLSFLCDAPTAPNYASFLLSSDYASLAGITSSPLPLAVHPLLSPMDGLPHTLPRLTDSVLFSLSHCLNCLLVSCRSSLYSGKPYVCTLTLILNYTSSRSP